MGPKLKTTRRIHQQDGTWICSDNNSNIDINNTTDTGVNATNATGEISLGANVAEGDSNDATKMDNSTNTSTTRKTVHYTGEEPLSDRDIETDGGEIEKINNNSNDGTLIKKGDISIPRGGGIFTQGGELDASDTTRSIATTNTAANTGKLTQDISIPGGGDIYTRGRT